MRRLSIITLACVALTACAPSPDAIAPVSMGGVYDNVSCANVRPLVVQERNRLAALSAKQRKAVTGDAVGVFLIGVPVSSLSGDDVAGEIATSKGKINAMEARLLSCA